MTSPNLSHGVRDVVGKTRGVLIAHVSDWADFSSQHNSPVLHDWFSSTQMLTRVDFTELSYINNDRGHFCQPQSQTGYQLSLPMGTHIGNETCTVTMLHRPSTTLNPMRSVWVGNYHIAINNPENIHTNANTCPSYFDSDAINCAIIPYQQRVIKWSFSCATDVLLLMLSLSLSMSLLMLPWVQTMWWSVI